MDWDVDLSEGTYDDGAWTSDEVVENVPRRIKTEDGTVAILAYITKAELDLLISYGSTVKDFAKQISEWEVDYYGPPSELYPDSDMAVQIAPLYFITEEDEPISKLVFITYDQVRVLKESDLHNADLKNQTHQGVDQIPAFHRSRKRPKETPVSITPAWLPSDNYIKQTTGTGIYAGSLSALGNLVAMSLNDKNPIYTVTAAAIAAASGSSNFFGRGLGGTTSRYGLGSLNATKAPIYKEGQLLTKKQYDALPASMAPQVKQVPYNTGFFREYWYNQKQTIFGNDSAIPALTGVIPRGLRDYNNQVILSFNGNVFYYIDLQIQRLLGQGKFNLDRFISVFRQAQSWVETSNKYLASLKNSEKPLRDFKADTLEEYATQKWNKYKTGKALTLSFRNLGKLGALVADGEIYDGVWRGFGTTGWVAKSIIENQLADQKTSDGVSISDALIAQGITITDVYNPDNEQKIKNILEKVNNASVLKLIQEVLETKVPIMSNLMDYTSIEKVSGKPNDSSFKSLEEIGQDIFENHNTLVIESGPALADLVEGINLSPDAAGLEKIRGRNSQALDQEIANQLRRFLPMSPDGGPVSILQIIGMSSGYLKDTLDEINVLIDKLYKGKYGITIRDTLTEISRLKAEFPLTPAEALAAKSWIPSPTETFINEEFDSVEEQEVELIIANATSLTVNIDSQNLDVNQPLKIKSQVKKKKTKKVVTRKAGPSYWQTRLAIKIQEYYDLLGTAAADSDKDTANTIKTLNEKWNYFCQSVYYEIANYQRGNFSTATEGSNATTNRLNFAAGLVNYGADSGNIGTSTLLSNLTQNNDVGNQIKTILGMGKNDSNLGQAGISRTLTP
jgi:hypothetical protein